MTCSADCNQVYNTHSNAQPPPLQFKIVASACMKSNCGTNDYMEAEGPPTKDHIPVSARLMSLALKGIGDVTLIGLIYAPMNN